jgi:hypothetical protein
MGRFFASYFGSRDHTSQRLFIWRSSIEVPAPSIVPRVWLQQDFQTAHNKIVDADEATTTATSGGVEWTDWDNDRYVDG